MTFHEPVLYKETLEFLNVQKGDKVIDCTLGDGGHTLGLLKKGAIVLGMDYSPDSLKTASKRIAAEGLSQNFIGVQANFKDLTEVAKSHGFENVSGILYDLGYSSSQVEDETKGFSYIKEGPLDMRIDSNLGVTAADLVNTLPEKQLAHLFWEYGEERLSKRFAKEIVACRELKPFETTKDLSDLLVRVAPSGYDSKRLHPATRVFQALRIVVNDELENLKKSLPQAASLLKLPNGRLLVISFHSLEDRVVKKFGQEATQPTLLPLVKKPLSPTASEIKVNKRARSAKLRAYETVAE